VNKNRRWLWSRGVLAVMLLAIAVFTGTGNSVGVSVSSSGDLLSISSSVALAASPAVGVTTSPYDSVIRERELKFANRSNAITATTLGTNSDKAATSPWTALSSLSLTADDYVFVCEAADSQITRALQMAD